MKTMTDIELLVAKSQRLARELTETLQRLEHSEAELSVDSTARLENIRAARDHAIDCAETLTLLD